MDSIDKHHTQIRRVLLLLYRSLHVEHCYIIDTTNRIHKSLACPKHALHAPSYIMFFQLRIVLTVLMEIMCMSHHRMST